MDNKKVAVAFLAVLVLGIVGILIFLGGGDGGEDGAPQDSTPDLVHQNGNANGDVYTPSYIPEWERAIAEQADPLGYVFIGGERFGISETHVSMFGRSLRDEDIQQLAYMPYLQSLYLRGGRITDLSPLAGLENLQLVWLDNNQISDLSPLAGLENLLQIGLGSNQISDISPLSSLTNLQILDLGDNQISDISTLSEISLLWSVQLNDNPISDLSPLADLQYLSIINIDNVQTSDISALADMENLFSLQARGNQISNIAALAGLENVSYLFLDDNEITDIAPLADLNLVLLGLNGNPIQNWSPVRHVNLVAGRPATPGQVIYVLSHESFFEWREVGFGDTWGSMFWGYPFGSPLLDISGNPMTSIVEGPDNNAIALTQRNATWYALDLLIADSQFINLEENDYYIEVRGRNNSENMAVTVALIATEGPWNALHDILVQPGEEFTLSGELSLAVMDATAGGRAQFMERGLRLQTHCIESFTVYEIIISAR